MNYEKAIYLGIGILAGAGAVCLLKSKTGHNAAVAIASKGLELKEKVAAMAERAKEKAGDVVAEAKYLNEQKAKTE